MSVEQGMWIVDDQSQQLQFSCSGSHGVLDDDSTAQPLPYRLKQLVNLPTSALSFSIEDATHYQQALDYFEPFTEFDDAERHQIALCVAAWLRFGRPHMPQSWHFQQAHTDNWPVNKRLCELNSGFAQGLFYIIARDDEFSECMLIDGDMPLSDIKTLHRYQTVKVLHNRLLPATIELIASTRRLA
ncbi:cell division protein ZapC domain-containing protein [Idiomarina xiamenensis]|uniref:Cell division protein ZapC n=1 Tax=Idiomarina xiamenensis 10-D-4 TaxID=740709 RepID=K2JUB0_9GAMM|nr:cell division protein ZapC domain-containing protein [Idiomarina xiamenensis]EKE87026.1 hypothetical protein A10D4_02252 [Idiomarina xiamenensis 10-D-4]